MLIVVWLSNKLQQNFQNSCTEIISEKAAKHILFPLTHMADLFLPAANGGQKGDVYTAHLALPEVLLSILVHLPAPTCTFQTWK